MIILNKNYKSIYTHWLKDNFSFARLLGDYFYPEQRNREKFYYVDAPQGDLSAYRAYYPEYHSYWRQFLGGFQPVADMIKDFLDTWKPYKSTFQVKRDLKQPGWALLNAAKGSVQLIAIPFFYLFSVSQVLFAKAFKHQRSVSLLRFTVLATSWVVEGAMNLLRGVTQFFATPLTYLVKIPLRAAITLIAGTPKIEQNTGLQKLVEFGKKYLETYSDKEPSQIQTLNAPLLATQVKLNKIFDAHGKEKNDAIILDGVRTEIHRKYVKSLNRGQPSDIPREKEDELFSAQSYLRADIFAVPVREDRVRAGLHYLSIFSQDKNEQAVGLRADSVMSCYMDDDYNDGLTDETDNGIAVMRVNTYPNL